MSGLRETPFHRALHRPNLMFGGERTPMLIAILVPLGLVVASQNLVALVAGVLISSFAVSALRMAAKKDPQMIQVYRRQRQYQRYYHPYSRPWRVAETGRREY